MAGAVALAATAALRSGAGYVEVVCPHGILPALTEAVPAAMVHTNGDAGQRQLEGSSIDTILEVAARSDALVIGPGLGPSPETAWVPQLLEALQSQDPEIPILLDADGLNQLAATDVDLNICSSNMILTPHPGEAARLLGWDSASLIQADRDAAMTQLMSACDSVVLLKGAGTLIGQRQLGVKLNRSGNSALATAGSGDVLSGHVGALLAAGITPFDAARLGAYLHGRAGDMYAAEWGQDGLTASDLAKWLSKSMREWRANPTEVIE